jgi:hypothetical protein
MERWRDGEMERWRDGEMERWRDGRNEVKSIEAFGRSSSVRIAATGRVLMREENGEPPQQPRKTKLHSVIPS